MPLSEKSKSQEKNRSIEEKEKDKKLPTMLTHKICKYNVEYVSKYRQNYF